MEELLKELPYIDNFLLIENSLISEDLKYVERTSASLVLNFMLCEATVLSIGALAHVTSAQLVKADSRKEQSEYQCLS